jgi:DNA-binding MarR family transcriptional regulator
MALDHKFNDLDYIQFCGWGKILGYLKKQFDKWAVDRLAQKGYKGFKMTYMPVILNIDPNGTSNNDLALRAKVTKQAMSKVIKELQKSGYVSSKTDPNDKRSTIFKLTSKGENLIKCVRESVGELMDEYRKLIGKKNYDGLLTQLITIIEYMDKNYND